MKPILLKSQFGFSIPLVLVASGIMTLILLALSVLAGFQQSQNSALEQKLEAIGFEQYLQKVMADRKSCDCIFKNQNLGLSKTAAVSTANRTKPSLSLSNGCKNMSSWLAAATNLPGTQTNLRVSEINFENVKSYGSDIYSTELVIHFDPASVAAGVLKPLRLRQGLQADPTGNISGCLDFTTLNQAALCTSVKGKTYNLSKRTCDVSGNSTTALAGNVPPGAACIAKDSTGQDLNGFTLYDDSIPDKKYCCYMQFPYTLTLGGILPGGVDNLYFWNWPNQLVFGGPMPSKPTNPGPQPLNPGPAPAVPGIPPTGTGSTGIPSTCWINPNTYGYGTAAYWAARTARARCWTAVSSGGAAASAWQSSNTLYQKWLTANTKYQAWPVLNMAYQEWLAESAARQDFSKATTMCVAN